VARLNGEPLTIADLRGGFPGGLRGDPGHALDAAVARRLAAQEARRRGLDATPDVQAQIEALRREAAAREEALLQGALEASLAAQIAVSEDELRARYEQTPGRYTEKRLRLRRAAFPSAEAARAADERLGVEGRLDPAASEEIGPAPVQKLMQMRAPGLRRLREPGQRIVVGREGDFALIELLEVLPPEPPPFEEVREQLASELRAQKAGEAFAKLTQDLRAAARLEIDEAVLKDDAAWQASAGEAAPRRQRWR
jgi:peptidyl-prolyl cis-trans isomerase C